MSENNPFARLPEAASFSVTSTTVGDGDAWPAEQLASGVPGGRDVSPQLSWSGAPEGTRSYAVTIYDPDAPTGSGFWHWIVIDIPASVTSLPAGAGTADGSGLPAGAFQVRNDYGTKDFGGAAPPAGDEPHRYVFAVHALDVETLGIDSDVTPAVAGFNLRFHTIARGLTVPVFGH